MERKLAAILSADVKGYSRLIGEDDTATIRTLSAHRAMMSILVQQHGGRVAGTQGDNLLAEFPSVVAAAQCAAEIQRELKVKNAELPADRRVEFRMGINLGEIIVEGEQIHGDGVNIAARLEALAEVGGICISQLVYEQIKNRLPLRYEYVGERTLKNIEKPVPVWRVVMEPAVVASQGEEVRASTSSARTVSEQGDPVTLSLSKGDQKHRVGTTRLSRITLAVAGLLIVGGIVTLLYPSLPSLLTQHSSLVTQEAQPPLLPLPDKPSIVVLPFVNMSEDPKQEYFSDGITEDLTTALAKVSALFVIARNSAFVYKGKTVGVKEVSRELGVRYVLEGSVRKVDDRVRITAQLLDGPSAAHVWAESYDRELKDIFAVQDEVRQKIVLALKVKLTPEEQERFRRAPTDNLEAYEYFLRGAEYHYRLTKEANAQARQLFEKALALDPQYAGAYAWLGWTYFVDWLFHWSQDPQNFERAFELAQRAVALDDSQRDAHQLLGFVSLWQQQPEQALAEEERAIALDPNYADSYADLAEVLSRVGRPEEAIGVAEKAIRLDPRGPAAWYLWQLGFAYRLTGRVEEAIATQKQVLMRDPNFQAAYTELTFSYVLEWVWQLSPDPQTLEQALAMAQKAIALNDSPLSVHTALGSVYLWKKQPEQARAEAERAIALDPILADGYATLAAILNAVGRPKEAIGLAEKATRPVSGDPYGYLYELGQAYCLTGRYEEAIATLKKLLSRTPNLLHAHLVLAIAYSESGRAEEARAAAAEVLRISPNFSLEVMQQRWPYKDPAVVERQLAALRQAGLK